MLQDQDHLFFSRPRSVRPRPRQLFQDQDRFFKTIKLLTHDVKKRFLTEKIRPVIPVLLSRAGIMPVAEINLLITGFLVKFCFIQN